MTTHATIPTSTNIKPVPVEDPILSYELSKITDAVTDCMESEDYEGAIELCKIGINKATKVPGKSHGLVESFLVSLCDAYGIIGDCQKEMQCYAAIYCSYMVPLDSAEKVVKRISYLLAYSFAFSGVNNPKQALELLFEAEDLYYSSDCECIAVYLEIKKQISLVCLKMRDINTALANFDEVLSVTRDFCGCLASENFFKIHNFLFMLVDLGYNRYAEKYLKLVENMIHEDFESDQFMLGLVYHNFSNLYSQMKKPGKSNKYSDRAVGILGEDFFECPHCKAEKLAKAA